MKNWQKDRNYRKYENVDGSFTYVVTVDGVEVDVNVAVYEAYSQHDRRMRYLEEREAGYLMSLDRMNEDGVPLYLSDRYAPSAEDMAIREMLVAQVMESLSKLSLGDRRLIQAVVMDSVAEQEYADSIGVTQVAVHKRKKRILKNILKNIYF